MATQAQSISAPPADKQIIEHNGQRYTTVKEGLAHILVPAPEEEPKALKNGNEVQQVFYNPIQQFNRDLTVLVLQAYGKTRVEEKKSTLAEWKGKRADKRKRKDERRSQKGDEPPAKIQKVSKDDGSAKSEGNKTVPAVPTSDAAQTDISEAPKSDEPPQMQPIHLKEEDNIVLASADDNQAPAASNQPSQHSKPQPVTPSFTILDALSASGLRALRYAHELPFVTSVTSNDIDKSAVEAIKMNVEHNRLGSKIRVTHDDAVAHMYNLVVGERRANIGGKPATKSEKYDVVDLDPYGTAAPFFDAAVQSVRDDGGLICITCTDSGVWASNGYPEKCYSLYGGVPIKAWYSHEVGIRIILHGIESAAARYGLAIEPLLSLSIDFYIRVFVKVRKSPAQVKFQGGKNMVVYGCDSGCGAWTTQLLMKNKVAQNKRGSGVFYKHGMAAAPTTDSKCQHCHSTMHLAGPMYAGFIHSPAFIESVLAELPTASTEVYGTTERINGMLRTALEEMLPCLEEENAKAERADDQAKGGQENKNGQHPGKSQNELKEAKLAAIDPFPFFFQPALASGMLHCTTPSDVVFRGALHRLGYRTTRSHCKPGSMKTDAPWSVIWHVMREWVRQKAPVTVKNINPGSPAYRLLRLGDQQTAEGPNGDATDGGPQHADEFKDIEVVFDEGPGHRNGEQAKIVRYQNNPRENWGPMSRAKGK